MAKALKNDNKTESTQSKIGERVLSIDKPVSKMAKLLEEKGFAPRALSRGETVEGQIVSILSDSALIDIGSKAEGIIPIKELQDSGEKVEIGNKISAMIAQPEGDSGTAILTVKKTIKDKVWDDLQNVADKDNQVDVKGIGSNRGGLIVEYKGIRGFIPSSHLVSDIRQAVGKTMKVNVIQVNENFNKLVFSEKDAAPDTLPKIELPFKIGDTLDVTISKMLPFGLLAATPSGPDGLVHISEISWKKVTSLQDRYKIGQKIKVKVISIDVNTRRINLSIKQLEKNPWQEAAKKYKVGSIHERQVTRGTSYGVFVELEEGIEGLIHSSKIPYGVTYKSGDELKVQIDLFDSDQKRVALRIAQEEKEEANKKTKQKEKPQKKHSPTANPEVKKKIKTKIKSITKDKKAKGK